MDDERAAAVSVGWPIPGAKVKVEENVQLSDENVGGEIMISGSQLMAGYFCNEATTTKTIVNGWLHMGDLGYIKDGHVYLIERLETSAFGADFGVKSINLLALFVAAEQQKAHLRRKLTVNEVDWCETLYVDCIPKNAAGKVLEKALREMVGMGE
ncbi:acetyl-CoA synthetase-like protein [Piedraia hortae CBS 480.64]|uniref:Acetyl-CoA synthetase-like protein n=1 Tax=Piedraia hortae CBS 480.64 TaxID=1314780 RepID=A0A6A7C178_9PEZI|nr:acetyl-CoA synthetase-like protein [Piedraia hortae CBS 480.64]